MSAFTTPVQTVHSKPYAAIATSRPELSQRGRTVLVTGSTGGIGLAIAQSFAAAGASTVILTGRSEDSLAAAAASLSGKFPATTFVRHKVDVLRPDEIAALWDGLSERGIVVDVLVLSAARTSGPPIQGPSREETAAFFAYQIGANTAFADFFYNQTRRSGKKLYLVQLTTAIIASYPFSKTLPLYAASKAAATAVMQHVANTLDPSDMQVVDFHPGTVFTPGFAKTGVTEDMMPFDHVDLAGNFAVWAASDEATLLHGRFTWAGWDVDEIKNGEVAKRIESDPNYLRVGIMGL